MKSLPQLRPVLVALVLAIFATFAPFAAPDRAFAQDIFGIGGGAEEEPAASEEAPADAPLDALLEVLRDDEARQQLITELEAQVEEPQSEPAPVEDVNTFGGRIADFTQGLTESAAGSVDEFFAQIGQAPSMFAALGDTDYRVIGELAVNLALLVLVTYGAFLFVRYLTENFRNVLKLRSSRSGPLAAVLATIVLLVSNLIIVVAAWAVGQVVAVAVIGTAGRMAFHHSLFLNAFLVVEIIHAFVRAILSPGRPALRLVSIPDEQANMLTRWARLTVSILVFVQLLAAPIFDRYVSVSAGEAVSVVGYVVVLALMVNLTLRLRAPIGAWLEHLTSNDRRGVLRFIARFWHLPVLIYLFILFLVVVIWPEAVLLAMLVATAKILFAVIIGAIAANLLTRVILSGIRLPERVSSRIPLLEQRLNSFVPRALNLLRLLVVIVVAAYILEALGLFSVGGWLDSELGAQIAGALITVAIILLVAFAVWLTVSSWVDYRLQPSSGRGVSSRERTLLALLRNAVTVTIIIFAGMFALSEIGINIAPLLASAGVIGLAIGFGAQKLVQDIITGIFIQLEGAIDVGDVVDIGGISGSVERLTIRSAGLRDLNGVYHIVPFSSVTTVSNFMRGFSYALCDIGVAYRENIEEVKQALFDAYDELKQNPDIAANLVDPAPEWMGIDQFLDSSVTVRLRIRTLPGTQWGTRRAYFGIVKRIFDEREIEIPFPHQTVYFGTDKAGKAPPLHFVNETDKEPDGGPPSQRGTGAAKKRRKPTPATEKATDEARRSGRKPPELPDNEIDEPGDEDR